MSSETKFTKGDIKIHDMGKKTSTEVIECHPVGNNLIAEFGSRHDAELFISAPKLYALLEELFLNEDMGDQMFDKVSSALQEARGE